MRKSFLFLMLLAIAPSLFLTSCGPSKKLMASNAQVDMLQKDSLDTQRQLKECNAQVISLINDKHALENENASVLGDLKDLTAVSNLTIAEQAERLNNVQTMLQSQKTRMDNLKTLISEALMNFEADELSVYMENGKVHVSLEEKLLFKSGSDIVDPKGKQALKSLANVLTTNKNIIVLIEGHTDNIPIKTKQFQDNWDLSTARAASIVRILTIDNLFDSKRISASGYSQYHPVQTNDTVEGRAANRRTEIILSPDLKELDQLLYK